MLLIQNQTILNFYINNKLIKGKLIGKEKHKCLCCKKMRNCLHFKLENNEHILIGIDCLNNHIRPLKTGNIKEDYKNEIDFDNRNINENNSVIKL